MGLALLVTLPLAGNGGLCLPVPQAPWGREPQLRSRDQRWLLNALTCAVVLPRLLGLIEVSFVQDQSKSKANANQTHTRKGCAHLYRRDEKGWWGS